MMERCKHSLKFLNVIMMLITLFIFMSFGSVNAYALNENYVIDEYHNWLDVEHQYNYQSKNDGFDGFLKTVSDEDEGCFYIFFKFFDTRILNGHDENIILNFTVENSAHTYCFSINNDGFINTGQNDINAVQAVYNFDGFSCSSMGGEIFIGFELKNSADRVLTNYISCNYASGVDTTAVLFENEVLDLYVEPTEKVTTTKRTTEKSTAAKAKASQSKSNTSAKSSSTKSGKNTSTTKFKSSGKYSGSTSEYDEISSEAEDDEVITIPQSSDPDVRMSTAAIVILIVSIIVIAAGIIVLIIALVLKSKKDESKEECEESSP